MNILYLSDIHFGRELMARGNFNERNHIQNQLIDTIAALPLNMKPQYIVVTGDVAWTGNASEYEMAYVWFKELLDRLGLDGKHLAFCAGNHDVNRMNMVNISLDQIMSDDRLNVPFIDQLYKYESTAAFNVQIHAFNDFCERLGVIPYNYQVEGEEPESDKFHISSKRFSYTVGVKDFAYGDGTYRIVGLNTAMLSGYTDLPDDENFLGLPQIEKMEERNLIGTEALKQRYIIALFHHAERFLNTNEMNSYGQRPATLYRLLSDVNLALCGHTETGAVPLQRAQQEGGVLLNGGAAYYSDDHPNTFSLLHIEPENKRLDSCTFIYRNGRWRPFVELNQYNWTVSQGNMRFIDTVQTRTPCILRVSTGEKTMELPFKILDDGLCIVGNEYHRFFANRRDINRLLDLTGDEKATNIKIAEGRERSVKAILQYMELIRFINENTDYGKKAAAITLRTDSGGIMAAGEMTDLEPDVMSESIYSLLKRIEALETTYNLQFSLPDTFTIEDQLMVQNLEVLLEDRGIVQSSPTTNRFVYFTRRKGDFNYILNELEQHPEKAVCLMYKVPMRCHLFGATIKLGMCRVPAVNLMPDNIEDMKKQRDTFMEGDTRRLTFRWVNDTQQIVIMKEEAIGKSREIDEFLQKVIDNGITIEIPPQQFYIGKDRNLEPDLNDVEKLGMKLDDSMSQLLY